MASNKTRIDVALVEQKFAPSRARAQALILAGIVVVNDKRVDKAGHLISPDSTIRVKGKDHGWVSRGGLKLEKGLKEFNISTKGMTIVDVGASTGGFTHVSLDGGAEKVYAVDVGHGQLDWKLRTDDRVIVLEKTNARSLSTDLIPDPIDMILCDASFISLKTVLPASLKLVKSGGYLVALIKPQFEVGKENVGKKGVVREPSLHIAVCEDIKNWVNLLEGWDVIGITESPIKGPEGNIEFLLGAKFNAS